MSGPKSSKTQRPRDDRSGLTRKSPATAPTPKRTLVADLRLALEQALQRYESLWAEALQVIMACADEAAVSAPSPGQMSTDYVTGNPSEAKDIKHALLAGRGHPQVLTGMDAPSKTDPYIYTTPEAGDIEKRRRLSRRQWAKSRAMAAGYRSLAALGILAAIGAESEVATLPSPIFFRITLGIAGITPLVIPTALPAPARRLSQAARGQQIEATGLVEILRLLETPDQSTEVLKRLAKEIVQQEATIGEIASQLDELAPPGWPAQPRRSILGARPDAATSLRTDWNHLTTAAAITWSTAPKNQAAVLAFPASELPALNAYRGLFNQPAVGLPAEINVEKTPFPTQTLFIVPSEMTGAKLQSLTLDGFRQLNNLGSGVTR
jgi:hypothetical protein